MRKRNRYSRDCIERIVLLGAAVLVLAALSSCTEKKEARVGMREDFRMGPFTLRAVSVEAYTRTHQGVPFEVEVRLRCTGGNRFDRLDFGDTVTFKSRAYFRTSAGWRDRVAVLSRGDRAEDFAVYGNPPPGSSGFVLEIGNPYAKAGDPDRFLIDLGR
jgi:hypothetical protein